MIAARLPLLAPLLAGVAFAAPTAAQRGPGAAPPMAPVTSITIRQRLIIRVPRVPAGRVPLAGAAARAAPAPPQRWTEKRAGTCVPVIDLAAAAVNGADSVDLILNGGRRLRARFDDACPTLDFYSGFYVHIPADGKVCAARDSIRSRSGGECRIESFRKLVPAK